MLEFPLRIEMQPDFLCTHVLEVVVMNAQRIFVALALLACITGSHASLADQVYLAAGFDDKTVDQPIGTGGAAAGEPVSVSPYVTAYVRDLPMPTPALEIADDDDYYAGNVRFEFLDSVELTTGMVFVYANLWFEGYEDFFLYVREQGGASRAFTSLRFAASGTVYCSDQDSPSWAIGSYETGKHYSVLIIYNMTTGRYGIWLNETAVVTNEPHGVTDHGVGSVLFGCGNDADLSGAFCVDDVFVGRQLPPHIFLRANFNNQPLDQPIGTDGPEVGEPVYVSPVVITAIVRAEPLPSPSLELQDIDDYTAGAATFEFLRDTEVTHGVLVIAAHLWFDVFDMYEVGVREHGSAARTFSDVRFFDGGYVVFDDENGGPPDYTFYDVGRTIPLLIIHDLEARTYDVWLDGLQIVDDEPHGITDRGIGSVYFGCINDPDYDGRFYVDNIWVADDYPPELAACCIEGACERAIAGDCAFNQGEFHSELPDCVVDPCPLSGVAENAGSRVSPDRLILLPVRPNPFRTTTRLDYLLAQPATLRLDVLDAAGRLMRTWPVTGAPAGYGSILWDGNNDRGERVPPGVYFGRLTAGSDVSTQRVLRIN